MLIFFCFPGFVHCVSYLVKLMNSVTDSIQVVQDCTPDCGYPPVMYVNHLRYCVQSNLNLVNKTASQIMLTTVGVSRDIYCISGDLSK